MIAKYFYNETMKTAVAVFGSIFDNIVIKRKDGKVIPVPISYGPRTKWLEAQKELDRNEEIVEKLLPRMSYEMVAMQYDPGRKLTNKQQTVRTPDNSKIARQKTQTPVPYTLDFSLYIQTKNLNDGWQIIEQILPFFTPAYTVRVNHFPNDENPKTPIPTNAYDMPIVLTAVTWADDWQGDLGEQRTIEWTLEFSTKLWLAGPVTNTTVIYDARAVVSMPPTGVSLSSLTRAANQEGIEVGYALLNKDSDKDIPKVKWKHKADSELLRPNLSILNLSDSEGNVTKIIREVDSI